MRIYYSGSGSNSHSAPKESRKAQQRDGGNYLEGGKVVTSARVKVVTSIGAKRSRKQPKRDDYYQSPLTKKRAKFMQGDSLANIERSSSHKEILFSSKHERTKDSVTYKDFPVYKKETMRQKKYNTLDIIRKLLRFGVTKVRGVFIWYCAII